MEMKNYSKPICEVLYGFHVERPLCTSQLDTSDFSIESLQNDGVYDGFWE